MKLCFGDIDSKLKFLQMKQKFIPVSNLFLVCSSDICNNLPFCVMTLAMDGKQLGGCGGGGGGGAVLKNEIEY